MNICPVATRRRRLETGGYIDKARLRGPAKRTIRAVERSGDVDSDRSPERFLSVTSAPRSHRPVPGALFAVADALDYSRRARLARLRLARPTPRAALLAAPPDAEWSCERRREDASSPAPQRAGGQPLQRASTQ